MQAIGPNEDFRSFLQRELIRRIEKNPRYSLRAYSRALGIESSALSKILSGKRGVSRTLFERFTEPLGLDPEQRHFFEGKLTESRGRKLIAPAPYHQLALDSFQVIADWYHFAILELVALEGFRPQASWIAQRLGVSVPQVLAAVARLKRMGLLTVKGGNWTDTSGSVTNIHTGQTDSAHRLLQRQLLEKAMVALDEIPLRLRDHTAMTMAIDINRIPAAKRIIQKFRRRLCTYLQATPRKTEVYQLSVALFPISHALGGRK